MIATILLIEVTEEKEEEEDNEETKEEKEKEEDNEEAKEEKGRQRGRRYIFTLKMYCLWLIENLRLKFLWLKFYRKYR